MTDKVPSHPGVVFPPPLLFVLGFVVGLLLFQQWPIPLWPGPQNTFTVVLARVLVILGAALLCWSMWTFFSARTAIVPNRPASRLIVKGPYRFSRNPMYIALTCVYVSFALWLNTAWPVIFLPLVLAALWLTVIRREERYLTHAFGETYTAYQKQVRRWL